MTRKAARARAISRPTGTRNTSPTGPMQIGKTKSGDSARASFRQRSFGFRSISLLEGALALRFLVFRWSTCISLRSRSVRFLHGKNRLHESEVNSCVHGTRGVFVRGERQKSQKTVPVFGNSPREGECCSMTPRGNDDVFVHVFTIALLQNLSFIDVSMP